MSDGLSPACFGGVRRGPPMLRPEERLVETFDASEGLVR